MQESAIQSVGQRHTHLYQIAYSEETWQMVPHNVLPLDNRANERPDWAEYWPIRRFLQNETLDENALYGFVSPRFAEKMLCTTDEIIDFISSAPDDVDVVAFSPYFDFRAVFRNVFEQGEFCHPGLLDLSSRVLAEIKPGINLRTLVNTSKDAIFCNYFVAKPRFWRTWMSLCESVFRIAESPKHPLYSALTRPYAHRGASQVKVFVIERLASLLLASSKDFKLAIFPGSTLSNIFSDISTDQLEAINSLKTVDSSGKTSLAAGFMDAQQKILNGKGAKAERARLISDSLEHGVVHAPSRGYEHWGSAPLRLLYAQGQISLPRFLLGMINP